MRPTNPSPPQSPSPPPPTNSPSNKPAWPIGTSGSKKSSAAWPSYRRRAIPAGRTLREAIAQSREQDVNTRFESIVKLLQDERLLRRRHQSDRTAKRTRLAPRASCSKPTAIKSSPRSASELRKYIKEARPAHPPAKRRPRPHRRRRRAERLSAKINSASPPTPANSAATSPKPTATKREKPPAMNRPTDEKNPSPTASTPSKPDDKPNPKPDDKDNKAATTKAGRQIRPSQSTPAKTGQSKPGKPSEGGTPQSLQIETW